MGLFGTTIHRLGFNGDKYSLSTDHNSYKSEQNVQFMFLMVLYLFWCLVSKNIFDKANCLVSHFRGCEGKEDGNTDYFFLS